MKTTVKCIIKFALISEILVAIIGQLGEFVLRIDEYIDFFKAKDVPEFDIYSILIAIGVVFLIVNLVFVVAVACELVLMIILVSVIWVAQLCLSLTILWTVIQPTVFTLLIISIVLILVLIFISILVEENRQFYQKNTKRGRTPIKLINVNDLDEL